MTFKFLGLKSVFFFFTPLYQVWFVDFPVQEIAAAMSLSKLVDFSGCGHCTPLNKIFKTSFFNAEYKKYCPFNGICIQSFGWEKRKKNCFCQKGTSHVTFVVMVTKQVVNMKTAAVWF